MLLAVNVNNKEISVAVFENGSAEPDAKFALAADMRKTCDEYAVAFSQLLDFSGIDVKMIDGAIMASVVPGLNEAVKQAIFTLTGKNAIVVGPGVKTGFAIKIDDPAELGADIVANTAEVVAILKEEKAEAPALILDLGAVTTLFAVSKKREIIGGAIIPGVFMSLDALHRETALLPNIEMAGSHRAIGRNTRESLISGVILGQASAIDGLVDRFLREMKCESDDVRLFATGEYADVIINNLNHVFTSMPTLTLKGLARIYKNTVG